MEVSEIKKLIMHLPDDMDINYASGYGIQKITCLQYRNGLCFANTPYNVKKDELDDLNFDAIMKAVAEHKKH